MHLLLQHLLFLLQGAGIYVNYGGEATLTNTNVFENEADLGGSNIVSASQTVPPLPCLNVTCTRGWQGSGGGLFIEGTATLTNTNVYANKAQVCWSFCTFLELSSSTG